MSSGFLAAAAAGFGTGLSLLVAIGAQNAFILRQGARGQAVLPVVALCVASDAVLIALGVAGLGAVVTAWPAVVAAVGLVGGAFLLCHGALAALRAVRPAAGQALTASGAPAGTVGGAVLTCLAVTWLNPSVYLDTVLMLGSLAAGHGPLRWGFGLGAVLASLGWFCGLGYGARLLGGLLSSPGAWRVLDGLVGATMLGAATMLLARTL